MNKSNVMAKIVINIKFEGIKFDLVELTFSNAVFFYITLYNSKNTI